jgi:conjugative transfer signal peptidase TraF
VEGLWRGAGESALVVGQDKSSVVPHCAPRPFLNRLKRFSHFADTLSADHTVWSVRHRMVHAGGALLQASQLRRSWFLAPATAVGMTALGAALLILSASIFRLRITLTDSSAAAGIYRLIATPAERGALVAACLPGEIARLGLTRGYLRKGDCPEGAEPVAKVVGALAGDIVELEPGWVAVNRIRFGNSGTAPLDSSNRPLAHVAWGKHQVGAGEVWLFGFNNARSWDARYFGPVPASNMRGVLRPLVTW